MQRPPQPPSVLIDGDDNAASCGIRERLRNLAVRLREIESGQDDAGTRRKLMSEVDLVVIGGSGTRAREKAELALSLGADAPRLLDLSGAHWESPDWTYGLPELTPQQADEIAQAPRVANPGSYATGVVALLRPIVDAGILPASYPVTINASDGYSIGDPLMFEAHQAGNGSASGTQGLALDHDQVPEMMALSRLTRPPIFVRSIGHFRQPILIWIPLHLDLLNQQVTSAGLAAALAERYSGTAHVSVVTPDAADQARWEEFDDTDRMELRVMENESRHHAVLVARMDYLGKGGIGAALQNIALMLGLETAEESPLIEAYRDA